MHATVPVADRDQLCAIKTGPRGKDRRYYKLSDIRTSIVGHDL